MKAESEVAQLSPFLASGTLSKRGILNLQEANASFTSAGSVTDENMHLDRLARTRLRVLDSISEGIYQVDLDGHCTFMNRAACCLLGYRFGEALGKHIQELHHVVPDRLVMPPANQLLLEDLQPPYASEFQETIFRKTDGSTFSVECRAHPIVNDGLVLGIVITFRDITERIVAKEKLERQAESLQNSLEALRCQTRLVNSIVASMADGVIAVSEKGEILRYNPAAASLLGEQCVSSAPDPSTLAEHGYALLLPDQQTPCPMDQLPLTKAVRGEIADGLELFVKTPGCSTGLWLSGTTRPMVDEDGLLRGGVVVFRDITEQKLSREALRRAKEEAEAANGAKSDFLSRMSHELRTPMNAILGFAQLLENDELTAEQRDAIARVLRAARHLLGLINEVLDISRIEAGRLNLQSEHLRPFDVMQSAIELIGPLADRRKIDLIAPPPSDARWYVDADRQRLMQVFVNLLGNGVKYNREGGRVTVSLEAREESFLRIKFADTGPGIAPEHLSKLFIPFERLGAERSGIEGTGIGLAYSHRLMTAMGGSIGVESKLGQGSVFWVELPLSGTEQRLEPNLSKMCVESTGISFDEGLATVLCIQDDPACFRQLETIFDRLPGYSLISAEQGEIGIQMALEHAPVLILLDLQLSDRDGLATLKELRGQMGARQTPIVVLSAGLTEDVRCRALDAGAHVCLDKPIRVREFLDTIVTII